MKLVLPLLLLVALLLPAQAENISVTPFGIGSGSTPISGGANTQVCFNDGGTLSCGSSSLTFNKTLSQLQIAQVGVISDVNFGLNLQNGTNATRISVSNTVSLNGSCAAGNFECGILDWQSSANVLTIGTINGGSGSVRNMRFVIGGVNKLDWSVTTANTWNSQGPFQVANTALTGFTFLNSGVAGINLNSVGSNFGNMSNVDAHTWQLGFSPSFALGTGVIKWTDNGNVTISPFNGHVAYTSTAPTANACAGFALTTGSSDSAGRVTFTSATSCAINFGTAYTNAPFCSITPGSAASTTQVTTTTAVLTGTFGTAQTAMQWSCFGT